MIETIRRGSIHILDRLYKASF